jgi:type VI secretion system secreted protein Hcp
MAADAFLKIDGIKGDSQDNKYKEQIEISSFSWGVSNGASGDTTSGLGKGKAIRQAIHFTLGSNGAVGPLWQACALGTHPKSATFICRKAGGEQQEYFKWEFTEVFISSVSISGQGGGESVGFSMDFNKVTTHYSSQKADGTLAPAVTNGYDFIAQVKT